MRNKKAFKKQHAKRKSAKPMLKKPNSGKAMHQNSNPKGNGITCYFCGKIEHLKGRCKRQLLMDYGMTKWISKGICSC